MIRDVNKQMLERADSLDELATMICGYGYYAHHKDDRDHPIPKEAIREYLEMGAIFHERSRQKEVTETLKLRQHVAMTKQEINTIIELFISWNDEDYAIDTANIPSAVDYIYDCISETFDGV